MTHSPDCRWQKPDPATHWRTKPIPFWMAVRGYLPKFLGGEMVHDAVMRVNSFGTTPLLMDYLMEQLTAASQQLADAHYAAIEAHLNRLCHVAKESRKLLRQESPTDTSPVTAAKGVFSAMCEGKE